MSTLALAPCTLIFTGADLASVHDQIAKYCVEKGLADAVEEAPVPVPAPAPTLFPYEKGLVKDFAIFNHGKTDEAFVKAYYALRDYGNSMPAKIAVVARELAAKHFPEHEALAGEYIYLRYLMGTSSEIWHLCHELDKELRKIDSHMQPNEFLTVPTDLHCPACLLSMGEFERLLHQAAAKLVKAGWKSHTNFNFAGTEFQRLAIICSKHKIDDLFVGGSLRAAKLDEELAKL